jgi:hypothetical protein
MAQLVVAAAGAAIGGSLITGTVLGMTGASLGWMAGSMLGSALFSKGQHQQGPRLDDLRVAGTEYGQTIPWVAGSPRIAGQIVWASDRREIANTQKVGKGGGGSKVTTYTYEVDLLILLTENEISGVSRIWSNGELVWNGTTTKDGVWSDLTIYTGASDQLPDPIYEAAVGVGNAPAYRGRGYVVIQSLQLGSSGQIPNLTFEVGTGTASFVRSSLVNYLYRATGGADQFSDLSLNNWGEPTPRGMGGATITDDGEITIHASGYATLDSPASNFPMNGDFTIDIEFQLAPRNNYVGAIENDTWGIYTFGGSQISGRYLGAYVKAETVLDIDRELDPPAPLAIVVGDGVGARVFVVAERKDAAQAWISAPHTLIVMRKNNVVQIQLDGGLLFQTSASNNIIPAYEYALGALESTSRLVESENEIKIRNFRFASLAMYEALPAEPQRPLTDLIAEEGTGDQFALSIRSVIESLADRASYETSDYDVDEPSGTKPVRGLAIGQVSSTRTVLEMLQQAWFYEVAKSDKIYIRPRAATSLVTIPFNELGTGQDGGESEPLALEIGSDIEIPAQVALSYNNMEADYNIATEHSDRIISGQVTTATVQMPLGMLSAEAKGVADALVIDQVASLTRTTVRLPLKYAYLEPGDVFEAVNFDGRTYRLRIQSKRDSLSVMECSCVLDDVGALQSAEITDDSYISTTDPVRVAPTLFQALDIPILRDADNDIGYYAAIAADRLSDQDEWPGAVFVQAFSTNAYEQEFVSGEVSVMGSCNTVLPDWTGGNVFDEASTLEVEVVGELSSSTRAAMIGNLTINAMLVGSEIIRFRLAELIDSSNGRNTYILSGLLRGQRGTEWAQTGHGSSEPCVLLGNPLRRVSDTLTEIGVERDAKAVTLNTLLSSATDVKFTNTAVGLKPFSPANVVALADGSDVVVTWQRRTRLAVKYGGAVDQFVPLGELSEQYRVEIYDGSNLVRTATVTSPTYTYTAANITADGFSSGAIITFSVAQLSAIVGAGYNTETEGIAP